jgi:capsular polysaccharide biosynthesis protein
MELQDYLKILRKRGWIIVLVALITAISAYGFSRLQTPEYKGYIKLHFRPARTDWGLQNAAKESLPSFREMIESDQTIRKVIEILQLDISIDSLRAKIATSADQAAFSITIEARDYIPEVAKQIVQTLAEVFKEEQDEWNLRQERRDRVEVYIRNEPRVRLFRPRKKINAIAGGIFGVLLGGLVVFFLEWLESDIIRTAEDVERYIGVTVLGSIPTITVREKAPPERRLRPSLLRGLNPTVLISFGAGFLVGAFIVGIAFTIL